MLIFFIDVTFLTYHFLKFKLLSTNEYVLIVNKVRIKNRSMLFQMKTIQLLLNVMIFVFFNRKILVNMNI